jgi:hypothetical protein
MLICVFLFSRGRWLNFLCLKKSLKKRSIREGSWSPSVMLDTFVATASSLEGTGRSREVEVFQHLLVII